MKKRSYLSFALALAIPFAVHGEHVACPDWSLPDSLSRQLTTSIPSHPEGGTPNVHIDTQGIAHAVWSEASSSMVKAKIAKFERRWGRAKTISHFFVGGQGPIAALNNFGKGSIPFIQYNHSPQQIVARAFGANVGELSQISHTQTFAMTAAADGVGSTLIAWVNEDENTVEATKFAQSEARPSTLLGTFSKTPFMKQLDIAINSAGMGVLAWNDQDHAFTANYFNGTCWNESPLKVSKRGASAFSTAMDITGRAHIIWVKGQNKKAGPILAASFQFAPPISKFGNLSSSEENCAPSLSISEQGRAVAVWTNLEIPAVEAAYFDGQLWNPPQVIQQLDETRASSTQPLVSVDQDGNAIVTWNREEGADQTVIESARFESLTQKWSKASQIGRLEMDPNIQTLSNLSLDVSLMGSAASLFAQYGAPTNLGILYGSNLEAPKPPQNVFGHYRGGTKVITWEPSSTPDITSYLVVRNGVKVATLSKQDKLEFEDAGRQKYLDTYKVRAITKEGTFSVFGFVRL